MAGDRIVVAGGGQAGFQVCASLRDNGFAGEVTLVCQEAVLPYERPPLSKAYLRGDNDITLRPQEFYASKAITLVHDTVLGIDRAAQSARLSSGCSLPYDRLVLATGARARRLPVAGARLTGVLTLRTAQDADAVRHRLVPGSRLAFVGGGFIGLEVASLAREMGCHTTVVETLPRVMARVVTAQTAARLTDLHRRQGTTILLGRKVTAFDGDASGQVRKVVIDDGTRLDADTVIVSVGVAPNVELALDAGLNVSDGVVVDEFLRTSDPAILAVGDCARFPSRHADGLIRLESVQNAVDQAHCAAENLSGRPTPYAAVPWFWSDQCGVKLQIAGIANGHDLAVVKGDRDGGGFSVFCFRGDRLVAVESVNRPADHILSRRLLASHPDLTAHEVAAPDFDLKARNRQPA